MPERNLRIIHGPNPLFAECDRCHARFRSHNMIPAEGERQVRAAFRKHNCEDSKKPPSMAAVRKNEEH
jgi:hypothetical protein